MKEDIVFDLIEKEYQRQQQGVELIASENIVSENVMRAMGTVLTNKYAEGLPGKRYYGGCEVVDEIEDLARERLKELFKLTWANVQPHSGAQANMAVCLACLQPGDKLLGFMLDHGGHLTHGSPVNFSGKTYQMFFYGVKQDDFLLDYDSLEKTALQERPKVIICGASAYSRDWDYKRIREIADTIGALVWADIAHPAGLIAKGLLNDPFDYCHIVTSTTHKTLRGPRGGVIMMRHDFENPFGIKTKKGVVRKMSSLLDVAVFPGIQGGPLEHVIASKAIAFWEALEDSFTTYGIQTIKNSKILAESLMNLGYKITTNGTDNHLVCVDLRKTDITGKEAEETLMKIKITVNKNLIPFDHRSPFITSGIRIGTPTLTTRGMKENDMKVVAKFIDSALKNKNDEVKLINLSHEVVQFASAFSMFQS